MATFHKFPYYSFFTLKTKFLADLSNSGGYSYVSLHNQQWIFTHSSLTTIDWVLSVASPAENIVSGGLTPFCRS